MLKGVSIDFATALRDFVWSVGLGGVTFDVSIQQRKGLDGLWVGVAGRANV